jgi:Cna protein B-type domain protein
MDINLDRRAEGYRARHRRNRIWKKLVTALGCLVVFCTTYALILPAITMERETVCGLSEHVHTDSCYSRQRGALVCALAESEGHTHTDACKGTKRVLSCTTPESDGHTHGEGCYDAEGVLTCTLPETQGHHHSDSCYRTEEVFVCGKAESVPHHHADECYAWETVATCGIQEHTHTDSCYPAKPAETTGATEMPTDSTTAATTAATENTETTEPTEETLLLQEETLALFAEGTESLPNVEISATSTPQASYDPSVNKFKTTIHVDFRIPGSAFSNATTYTYDYPEGIEIPENLLNQNHPLDDNRGTYRFEKVDGVYRLSVILSNVNQTQDDVTGFVNFNGTLDATKVQEDGRIVLGGVDNQLIIDRDEITYPSGETEKYDISASKSTDGNIDDGKLTYRVTISTKKGTPSPIQFTDTIQTDGLKLETPVVKVNGQERQATWNADTGTITMNDLPGLNPGQTHTIEYTYDVTDYPAAVMNPNNTLTVKAKDDGRKQEVTDEKNVSTKIDKTHTAAKVGKLEGSRIKWTITLNDHRSDITGATLTDEMFQTLSAGSDITVSPAGGYTLENGKITFNTVDGKKNNQRYTITYYTDAPEDEKVKEVINKASFDPDPGTPGDEIESVGKVGVGIDAAKSGTYDASQGTITWVITVNAKQRNIAGAVLTDDMLTHAQENSIQVSPASGCQLSTDESGKVSITFQPVDGEVNTNTYTVTYTTAAGPALAARTVSNTAHLKKGDHEEEVTAEVKIDSGGSVDKSSGTLTLSEDKTTGVLPWTVTIHVPAGGIPKGTVLEDSVGAGNDDIYMTNDQVMEAVAAFCQALGIQPQDVTVEIADGIYWSPNQYDYSKIDSYTQAKFRKLTLTLLKDWIPANGQAQDISVTYDTTLKIDPSKMNRVYYNYFKAGEWDSSAQFEYWQSGVEKTDGDGHTGTSTVTSQGDLIWKVIVTLDDTQRQSLDIMDTLPPDVTLKELVLIRPTDQWNNSTVGMTIGEDGTVSGQDDLYRVTGTYDKTTGRVSLKVTAVDGGDLPTKTKLTFVFGCRTDYTDNATHTFTNNVTVAGIGSDSQTQEWTYDNQDTETTVLGKIGTWHNDSRMLSYSVSINPDGKTLSPDGTGKLTLVDTLSYNKAVYGWISDENGQWVENRQFTMDVSLVQNSVKLYRVTKNEDGTTTETLLSVPWTFEEWLGSNEWDSNRKCILHMSDVPDGTHLRLEYKYQVETNAPKNGIIEDLSIGNKVTLEGTGYETAADKFESKWKETETSGQVTSGRTLLIYKVARGDYGTVLPGAEFTVYTVDTSVTPYAFTEYTTRPDGSAFPNPMITDESGRLTIRIQDKADAPVNFAYDTLYALKETKAPAGYRLPDTPQVFYFYFSNPEGAARTLPGNLPAGAMDLSQTDQQKFVENEPVPTYELPKTGGGGTRGFTLGGALVTVGGLYLLTRKKRRRRDA